MPDGIRSKHGSTWWVGPLATATVLRAVVALGLLGAMPMVSDAREYFDKAVRFASGDFGGSFYWPPGESLFLAGAFAVLGKSILVSRIVTVALSVATVALAALIAREVAGRQAASTAGWIAALYAPSVLLCGQTYSQHLAALCLASVAYFGFRALRERNIVLSAVAGAALGLGCLTRPSMASIVPVLVLAWIVAVRRHRAPYRPLVLGATAAIAVALAFVIPAQAHNARAGAGWTLSTNNERNLFLGNNPYTPDYKTSHLGQRSLDELSPDARGYLESFYARSDARAAMQREAISYIEHHPLRTAWRTIHRAIAFWGFDYLASREIQNWRAWDTRSALPLLVLEAGNYIFVGVLALIGLVVLYGACNSPWRLWLVALVLAYELPYAVAFSGGTYHFPVMPLVVPFAAVALAHSAEAWRGMRARRGAVVALAVFVIVQAEYAYVALAMSS